MCFFFVLEGVKGYLDRGLYIRYKMMEKELIGKIFYYKK